MSYSLDIESFIGEVERRPVIWDVNHEDGRNKKKKQIAWEDVARRFIKDFDDMNNVEKMDVYRKLNGKWRNIRDSYVRDARKRPGQKEYIYRKHLSFLDSVYKRGENLNSEDDWSEEDTRKLAHRDSYTEEESWIDAPEPSIEVTGRKRVKKEENPLEYLEPSLLSDTSVSNFHVEDEDRSFFDSLLPVVRSFNMDQKLEFRTDVLNLIKKIRKG